MLLGKKLLIIVLSFILQACTSPRMAEELEQGKLSFAAGNFTQAFHELLPVAVSAKNPQAQYAVGYMYFNGYGVAPDTESGIFWMNKAAEKGYVPAVDALRQIQRESLERAQPQQAYHSKNETETVVPPKKEALRVFPTTQNNKVKLAPPPVAPTKTAANVRVPKREEVLQSLI